MKLRLPIRFVLLICFQLLSVFAFSQTVGGVNPSDDFDGDGIINSIDLDDDNDGVLDVTEMTNCNTAVLITPSAATSSPVYGGSTAARTIDGSGFTGSGLAALATAPATLDNAWLLAEPLTTGFIDYTLPANSNIGGVVLWAPDAYNYGGGDGPPKDFTVEITYKNGLVFTTGVYTTARPNGSGANPGAQVFNFPQSFLNATKVKLNIINGWYDVNGNSIGQVSTDGQTVNAAYNMFLGEFRVLCGATDIDTDNDGIPNRLDLDSDGDGCPDALEAGVSGTLSTGTVKNGVYGVVKTTTNSVASAIAAAPYGANGLADGVETTNESGLINYTSKYDPQALSKNIASCADSDADGVFDLVDIDDDNDGVLDAVESPSCFYRAAEWLSGDRSELIASTSLAMSATYRDLTKLVDGNNGTAVANYSVVFNASTTAAQTVYAFQMPVPVALKRIYIGYVNTNTHFNTGTVIRLEGSNNNTTWTSLGTGYGAVTSIPGVTGSITANTFTVDDANIARYQYYRIYWVSGGGVNASGISNEVYFETATTYQASTSPKADCTNDTDSDGILNHLDLDSDNDGCSDASEAKSSTTATSTTLYPTGTDGNSNGLLNDYESTTAGVVNYTSSYDPFAISANLAACKDTDGDGVSDNVDLDDDNDGILDAVESPDCFYTEDNWHFGSRPDITVTSGLSMTSPQNQPQKLVDGKNSGVSYDVRMETTTSLVNALGSGRQVYKFNMNIPVKLSKILLGYTGIYSHFNDGTKLILRGSNDGTTWTNLSGTSGTPEVTYDATINSNSGTETSTIYPYPATTQYATSANIFSVTQNADKYQYYDIYWASGGGINNTGYANEIYFDVASDYIPSGHPKIDCSNDTDGDGILNHQDLDSDGDACSDAKESGISASLTSGITTNLIGSTIASGTNTVTIQNAVVAGSGSGTFGANGFANSLESSESGIYSGTYNYSFATNKLISTCLDSDGDGVSDVLDLDDDNDGVLDIVECPVPGKQPLLSRFDIASGASKTANFTGFPEELWIDIWTLDNNFNLKVNGTDITNVSELNFAPMSSSTVYTVPFTDIVRTNGTAIYPSGSVWTFPNTAQYPLIRVKISNNGYSKIYGYDFVNGTGNYNELVLVNAVYQKVPINLNGDNTVVFDQDNTFSPTYLNAEFNTFNSAGFCDTDGDGVENRLDLDSDEDGCSDAYEAKTTTSTTANFQYANNLSYGTNGFLNSLETVADNGIYNGYYPYDFAINATVKACLDSDTDGVPDVLDLDDDNDGVLDAIESPTCFYSLTELAKPASVSTDLNLYDATATYAITNSIDALNSTYSAFKSGQFLANKEILKFTANGLIDVTSLTLDLDFRAISTDAGSTFRFQGSADNVLWDNLNTAAVSSMNYVPPATLVLTNDLQAGKKYKYFRLYGVAGTSNYGGVANATFNLASSNRSSANPKLTCTNDTDVDGVPNHLDLDADGDGCPDAKEAGVIGTLTSGSVVNLTTASGTATSTTNIPSAVATGTYGLNGFANALETATESGNYSGTYNYDYAIIKTLNFCTDTDGDGIPDLIDIDDDNDGILDAIESPTCFYTSVELTQPITVSTELTIYSTYTIDKAIDNDPSATSSAFYPNQNWIGKALFNFNVLTHVPITGVNLNLINWSLSNASTANTFKLQGSSDNQIWTDLSSPIYSTATTGTLNIPNTLATNTKFKYFRIIGVAGVGYYGGVTDIKLVIPSSFVQSQYTKPTCTGSDIDGDGKPNFQDLDSDGDGCSDALEAGTTSSTTANFKFTGSNTDFGANGFYNALEKTNAESNLYKGAYTYYYATDNSINVCLDSDGDGTKDVIDLDDDNDGVLDYVEQSCTESNMSKSDITISSEIAWTFQNAPTGLSALFDGSLLQQMYPTATTVINNKTIFQFNFTAPKVLNLIELANIANQIPFIAGGTYKIQGSNDEGASWTDIVASQAIANSAPILATTNSIKFDMPSNYKAFLSYRIYAISMTGQGNWSTEAYFREVTCVDINTDGDATSNRLDLDSDGDGCPDAVEAGTTAISTSGVSSSAKLTTSIIPSPYGNNGFANGLETTSESGAYSGTYTYNYAISASINACNDTDGDGVGDIIDIDDDNDGVLDTSEQINCVTSGIDLNTLTYNGSSITAKTANSFTTAGGDVWKSSYSNEILKLPISLKFKHNSTTGYMMFGLFPITKTQTPTSWTDGAYKFYQQVSGTYGYFQFPGGGWDFGPISFTTNDEFSINISSTGYVTAAINGVTKKAFQGIVSDYKLALSSYRASSLTGIILTDAVRPAILTCTDLDTDNDGIANRLDLDSDGDGCADAVEAGSSSTARSLTTYPTGTDTNNNGLLNSYEATTSGTVNYTSTYSNYALVNTIIACVDTDGDGIKDVIDIDDDNDGILDELENACQNIFLETFGTSLPGPNLPTSNILMTSSEGAIYNVVPTHPSGYWFAGRPDYTPGDVNGNMLMGYNIASTKVVYTKTLTGLTAGQDYEFSAYIANPLTSLGTFANLTLRVKNLSNTILSSVNTGNILQGNFNWVKYTMVLNAPSTSVVFEIQTNSLGNNGTGEDFVIDDISVKKVLNCDTDGDGIPNQLDLDSDGDGCADAIESGSSTTATSLTTYPTGTDTNGNGLLNVYEGTSAGTINYSSTYSFAILKNIQNCGDYDGDGILDSIDIDDDNDGVLDTAELSGGIDIDTDGDGIPNRFDIDSDGDGCNDGVEAGAVSAKITVPLTGSFGANGYLNTLETAVDNGTISYTSTYAANALVVTTIPSITTQPTSRFVAAGTSVSFTVATSAAQTGKTITYKWYRNGVLISGATAATYTIASPTALSSGSYTCEVGYANSCSVTSNVAKLTVLSTQPTNATICQGLNGTLSLVVNSPEALTYQWMKGTTVVANGAIISGATSANLLFTAPTTADNGTYTCVITTASGLTLTSAAATLTVNAYPTISSTNTVCLNGTIALTGSATAATALPWISSNTAVGVITGTTFTGLSAGTTVLTYTNNVGCSVTQSVSVKALPVISGTLALCGSLATSQLAGTPSPALTSPWLSSNTAIATISSTGLVTPVSTYTQGGTISITYKNTDNCSAVASVVISPKPVIATPPADKIVCLNATSTTFTAPATAITGVTFTYQWKRSVDGGNTWTNITAGNASSLDAGNTYTGFNTTTLTVGTAVIGLNNAKYQVVITPSSGSCTSTSDIATLTVIPVPVIALQPSNSTLCTTAATSFTVATSNVTGLSYNYQWEYQLAGTSTWTAISATNASTAITGVTLSNYLTSTLNLSAAPLSASNTKFRCVINSKIGTVVCGSTVSAEAILNPTPVAPTITSSAGISFCSGSNTTLTASSSTSGAKYRWYLNSAAFGGAYSSTLVVNASGAYSVEAYLDGGCSISSASATSITVNPLPTASITQGNSVILGTTGSTTLTANDAPSGQTYTYLWEKLVSGTWTSLSVTTKVYSVTATGTYRVKVITASGCEAYSTPTDITAIPDAAANGSTVFCQGGSVVISTTLPAGATKIQWYGGASGTTAIGSPTDALSITATETGQYRAYFLKPDGSTNNYIAVDNGSLGDPTNTTKTVTVTVNPLPTASITEGSVAAFCADQPVLLHAIGGGTYQWMLSGNALSGITSANYTPTVSGDYSVKVTDAAGCVATSSSTAVTVNPLPSTPILKQNAQTICIDNSFDLTSIQPAPVSGISYEWHLGTASNSTVLSPTTIPAGTAAGTTRYYLFAKSTAGCFSSSAAEDALTIVSIPVPGVSSSNQQYNLGATPTALSAVSSNGYELRWWDAASAGTLLSAPVLPLTSPVGVVNYYVDQFDRNGSSCASPRQLVTVTIIPNGPDISVNTGINGNVIAYCENAVPATLTASGTNLKWYTTSTGGTATTTAPTPSTSSVGTTSYFVSQTVSGSESGRSEIQVSVSASVSTPSLTISQTTCLVATGDVVVASPTGAGYSYSADGISFQSSPTLSGLNPGTYSITVKNSLGCTAVLATIINAQPAKPVAPKLTLIQPACGQTTGTITISTPTDASYTYSIDGINYQSSRAFSGVTPGTYQVSVMAGAGCESLATNAVINPAPATPETPRTYVVHPTCTLATGTINIINSAAGYTHSIDGVNFQSSDVFTGLIPGTYSVSMKNASGCLSAVALVVVNPQPGIPAPAIVNITQTTCTVSTGSLTVVSPTGNGPSGSPYQYSIDGITFQTSTSFTGLSPDTYYVYVRDGASGCSTKSTGNYVINEPPATPAAPTISSSAAGAVCAGTSVTLTSSESLNNQWYESGNLIKGATGTTFTTSLSGIFTVITTNAAGCSSLSSTAQTVTINPVPTASIAQGTTLAFTDCSTTSINLTAQTSGTSPTYLWYKDGVSTAITTATLVVSAAGSYTVEITDAGCTSNSAVSKVLSLPTTTTATTQACQGGSILISANTTGYTSPTYQWEVLSGSTWTNVSTGGTSATYSATVSGSYRVTVTHSGGTSSSCPVDVTILALPTFSVSPALTASICAGSTTNLTGTSTATGVSYQWKISGTSIAGANTITLTTGLGGSYTLQITDGNGCQAESSASVVTVNEYPVVSVSASPALIACSGSAITLIANTSGSPTYQWQLLSGSTWGNVSSSGNSSTYSATATGSYRVVVTSNSCATNSVATAVTIATVSTPTLSLTQPTCILPSGSITINTPVGSGYSYSKDGINFQTGTIFTGLSGATYTITARDGNGCLSTSTAPQTISAAPTPAPATPGAISGHIAPTVNVATTYSIAAVSGAVSYTWTLPNGWTGTSTSTSITATPSSTSANGNITVRANGPDCSSALSTLTIFGLSPDTDGDGVSDSADLDNDNDGILDSVENAACSPAVSTCDTDGDGIPNRLDLDSDGDGISDVLEGGGVDTDFDGIADGSTDSNGVPSSASGGLTPPDTDGTGGSNPYDLDADGDGILDVIEGGGTDANNDGKIDTGQIQTPIDSDGDGFADYRDKDSDNDGILDVVEIAACSPSAANCDIDSDGTPNRFDLDSDGDGISDVIEAGGTDANNDGKADVAEDVNGVPSSASGGLTPPNTDGTGGSNPYDLDSDGDGIPDSIEKGSGTLPVDTDGDNVPDYLDLDSDGDGVLDNNEDSGCSGAIPCTPTDTDGDNVPDYLDLDSDGDGNPDNTDGNRVNPRAQNDLLVRDSNNNISGNILANDDFLPGANTSITRLSGSSGGTAAGTVSFDPLTGIMTYAPAIGESGSKTVVYQVCNTLTNVCATATVTIDVCDVTNNALDCDGDGVSNGQERTDGTDPLNSCSMKKASQNMTPSSAWLAADCDNDGNPNATDPNPPVATAKDDALVRATDGSISGNVLTNDDFLPGSGTSLTRLPGTAGGTATGTVSFNASTGAITYIPAAGETGVITVVYQVCNIATSVCATATVTISICNPNDPASDCDDDGVSNGQEKLDGTDPDNACSMNFASQKLVPNAAWLASDCDGDGVNNAQERTDGTDPVDACSYLPSSQILANTSAAWKAADCDGDGTPNETDSAPLDYCVGRVGFTIPRLGTAAYNNFFKNGDCDGDGISNHAECNGADNPDDFDGDGIPNYLDTDSDNDMMSDRDERRIDSDGDGDADYLDLDSDNDGILDKLEGNADADGDGIKNYLDLDSDGDGIKDAWEAAGISEYHQDYNFDGRVSNPDGSFPDGNGNGLADFLESSMGGKPRGPQDTDKDGIPDFLDLDSDGDSLLDSLEQTYDVDGDGRPNYRDLDSDGDWIADFIDGTMDTDTDGTKNFMDLDSDGDGIPDRYEGSAACDNCTGLVDNNNNGWDDRKEMVDPTPTDTDGDGTPDFKDLDSDNDGIPDAVEAGKDPSKPVDTDGDGTPDYQDLDSDNDGIPDKTEAGKDPNKPVDTDGDGTPDYQDLDSDNDGIPDKTEAGKDPSKPVDTDGDGTPDYQDTDSDNDGIPDSVEAGKDPSKPVDTDGDGKPDYQDTDSDNDGIPDKEEAGKDPNKPVDTDGDGTPDYQDTDSDNDGIPDSVEAGKDPSKPVDTDGDGKPDYQDTDSDNDGIPDSVEAGKDPSKPVDTDADGKPDYQDTDSDNDGIPDAVEAGKDPNKPVDTDADGKPDYLDTDSDNDGIPDAVEAGKDPLIPVDTDKDGKPDYQDTDSDNDGIPDSVEAGKDPSKPVDTDGDGKPDYQDTDSDNDGIPDAVEAGNVNNPVDTDGDGKPDYQDTDSDNDGIPDKIEAGADPSKPVDTDADGTPDYRDLDSDNDGYLDKEEAGKDPSNPVDTDKDGKADYQDTDSDNDGILDKLENDINYGALADCDKDGVDNRIDADQCPTFAPNGISPNGDGKNDVLIIPGILRNQPNELTIFNRWGNIVYQTSNYKNDWGGQTDRAFSLLAGDNRLPDGTYYYVIDFFGKYPNVGTYVYINRQEK